jgi:hypothetical protein
MVEVLDHVGVSTSIVTFSGPSIAFDSYSPGDPADSSSVGVGHPSFQPMSWDASYLPFLLRLHPSMSNPGGSISTSAELDTNVDGASSAVSGVAIPIATSTLSSTNLIVAGPPGSASGLALNSWGADPSGFNATSGYGRSINSATHWEDSTIPQSLPSTVTAWRGWSSIDRGLGGESQVLTGELSDALEAVLPGLVSTEPGVIPVATTPLPSRATGPLGGILDPENRATTEIDRTKVAAVDLSLLNLSVPGGVGNPRDARTLEDLAAPREETRSIAAIRGAGGVPLRGSRLASLDHLNGSFAGQEVHDPSTRLSLAAFGAVERERAEVEPTLLPSWSLVQRIEQLARRVPTWTGISAALTFGSLFVLPAFSDPLSRRRARRSPIRNLLRKGYESPRA